MGCGASVQQPETRSDLRIRELEEELWRLSKEQSKAAVVVRRPTWKLGVTLGFLSEFLTQLDSGIFKGEPDFTTEDLVEKFIKPA
eukprot:7707000-Pyramimonas_sp.AAC.1